MKLVMVHMCQITHAAQTGRAEFHIMQTIRERERERAREREKRIKEKRRSDMRLSAERE